MKSILTLMKFIFYVIFIVPLIIIYSVVVNIFDKNSPMHKALPKEQCMKRIEELDLQQFKHCTEDEISQILSARPWIYRPVELGMRDSSWKLIDGMVTFYFTNEHCSGYHIWDNDKEQTSHIHYE